MEAAASRRRLVVNHQIDKMREVIEAPTNHRRGRIVLSQNRETPGNQGFFFVAGAGIRRLAS